VAEGKTFKNHWISSTTFLYLNLLLIYISLSLSLFLFSFFSQKYTINKKKVSCDARDFALHLQRYLSNYIKKKNNFAKISKNLNRYTVLNIILLDHQNSYVENSNMMCNAAKSSDILLITLSVIHNYFAIQQNDFQIYVKI